MEKEDVCIQATKWDSKLRKWVPVNDYVEDLEGNKYYKR